MNLLYSLGLSLVITVVWLLLYRWMNPVRYKTPCSLCGSVLGSTQVTGPVGEETEYCGDCDHYRGGYKQDGVFR